MSYQEIPVEAFNGLDLRTDPIEVGAGTALDVRDVDFDGPGRVRTRPGLTKFNTTAGSGANTALFAGTYGGTSMLVAIRNAITIDTYAANGTRTDLGNLLPGLTAVHSITNYGSPTAARAYIAQRGKTLVYFNGATVTNSTGKPKFVASWQGRMVQANYAAAADTPSGADGSVSTVFFSSPTAPDTYGADDWVNLRGGDGEEIEGMVAWNEQLFVFKRTAVFVFYGIGVDSTGGAIFTYRKVDLPMGVFRQPATTVLSMYRQIAVAGTNGVYFATPTGIYLIGNGGPVEVSAKIQGVFTGTTSIFTVGDTAATLEWSRGKLFVSVDGGDTLVYSELTDQWTIWTNLSKIVTWDGALDTGQSRTYALSFDLGIANVYVLDDDATTDNGTAISWYYQSGHYPVANGQRARVREILLTGTGTVTLKVSVDMASVDTGGTVTLGVDPAVSEGRQRVARRGKFFSHYLSGSGSATVNRLVLHVADARVVA